MVGALCLMYIASVTKRQSGIIVLTSLEKCAVVTVLLTILKRTTKVTKRQDNARNSARILVAMYT